MPNAKKPRNGRLDRNMSLLCVLIAFAKGILAYSPTDAAGGRVVGNTDITAAWPGPRPPNVRVAGDTSTIVFGELE